MFDHVDITVGKKQGNVGVARAVYEYTRLGYVVLAPVLSDSDKYDLVIADDKSLKKVQVKTSRLKMKDYSGRNGKRTGYQVHLVTSGGNTKTNTIRKRKDADYDLLFVLVEDGRCWSIPTSELTATTQVCVGTAKYKDFEIK